MPSIDKNRVINVDITEKNVTSLLKPLIKGTNSKLIIECLSTLLSESNSFQNAAFMKACLGIEPDFEFKPGDKVLIKVTHLSDWNWDSEAMRLKDFFISAPDNTLWIKGVIYEIRRYSEHPYLVQYDYIYKTSTSPSDIVVRTDKASVSPISIVHAEEYAISLEESD
jgi:hypothetical protein